MKQLKAEWQKETERMEEERKANEKDVRNDGSVNGMDGVNDQ